MAIEKPNSPARKHWRKVQVFCKLLSLAGYLRNKERDINYTVFPANSYVWIDHDDLCYAPANVKILQEAIIRYLI